MGGGIDDKELLAEALARHRHNNKCGPPSLEQEREGGGPGSGEAGSRGEGEWVRGTPRRCC